MTTVRGVTLYTIHCVWTIIIAYISRRELYHPLLISFTSNNQTSGNADEDDA